MTTQPGEGQNIPRHPSLERLAVEASDFSDVVSLLGYIGPSREDGLIRLYPGLQDLSVCADIAETDVLHVEKAPESTLPNNGVIVWVGKDTKVTFRRTRTIHTEARLVGHIFSGASPQSPGPDNAQPDMVEWRRGRLRIQMRNQLVSGLGVCVSICGLPPPCHSSPICQSHGCALVM